MKYSCLSSCVKAPVLYRVVLIRQQCDNLHVHCERRHNHCDMITENVCAALP